MNFVLVIFAGFIAVIVAGCLSIITVGIIFKFAEWFLREVLDL